MKVYKSRQAIGQLEKRKGGYYFLKIEAEEVNDFTQGSKLGLFAPSLSFQRKK